MDRAEGRLTQPNRFGNLICKKSFVMTKSITNAVKNLLPTKKTAPPGAGPVEWLIVWSASTKNRRLLLCYKMGMDPTNPTQLIALIVRDNQNFRPDMRVPAREFAEGYYEYAGRLPRWRGEQLQSAAKL